MCDILHKKARVVLLTRVTAVVYGMTKPSPLSLVDWTIEMLLSPVLFKFPALYLQWNQHLFSA